MIYRKEYMQRLKAFKDNKIIKVITGLRRSGKSTLLEMFRDELLQSGVQSEQIQYINFELMKYDTIRSYKQLYDLVTKKMLSDKIRVVRQHLLYLRILFISYKNFLIF